MQVVSRTLMIAVVWYLVAACTGSAGLGGLTGSKETNADQKPDDRRPQDSGEGVPGYEFTSPALVKLEKQDGGLVAVGKASAVKKKGDASASTTLCALEVELGDSPSEIVVGRDAISIQIDDDGSFRAPLKAVADASRYVVLALNRSECPAVGSPLVLTTAKRDEIVAVLEGGKGFKYARKSVASSVGTGTETVSDIPYQSVSATELLFGGSKSIHVGDGVFDDTTCMNQIETYDSVSSGFALGFDVEQDDTMITITVEDICGVDAADSNAVALLEEFSSVKDIFIEVGGRTVTLPATSVNQGRYAAAIESFIGLGFQDGEDQDDFVFKRIRVKSSSGPITAVGIKTKE